MNKDEFIRELSTRSGLTIQDSKSVWSSVESIFTDSINNREEIDIRGFGHLTYSVIPPRKGHNVITDKFEEYPETTKLVFRMARNLRDLLLPESKRKIHLTRLAEQRRLESEQEQE